MLGVFQDLNKFLIVLSAQILAGLFISQYKIDASNKIMTKIASCGFSGIEFDFSKRIECNSALNGQDAQYYRQLLLQIEFCLSEKIRKFLRAAFHDCMGGCDGSISTSKTDDRGLEAFVQVITNVYNTLIRPNNPDQNFLKKLTRADFWVVCQQRALAWGIRNSNPNAFNVPKNTQVYGRPVKTVENNGPDESPMKNAAGGWSAMLATIKNGIPSLTETDIVALLGLHGSGTAQLRNSGFKGPWDPVEEKNIVNNHFYINLLKYGSPAAVMSQDKASSANFLDSPPSNIPQNSPPPPANLIEWVHTRGPSSARMMLPIDMQIYLSFTTNSTGGQSNGEYCPQGNNQTIFDCTSLNNGNQKYLPLAKNARLAFNYARNPKLFLDDLVPAFLKMVSYTKGGSTLTPFSPGWPCINKLATSLGDIFFRGCPSPAVAC